MYKIIEIIKDRYNIFIITLEHNYNFHKIMKSKNIFVYNLSNKSLNSFEQEKYLRKIIFYHNIDYISFEGGYFPKINFENLKVDNTKLVLILHGRLEQTKNFLLKNDISIFDAVFAVRDSIVDIIRHHNKSLFLNGVLDVTCVYKHKPTTNKIW